MAEKLIDPTGSDTEDASFPEQDGTQMYSNPRLPAYSPPTAPPPGAVGGPPGPMSRYGGGQVGGYDDGYDGGQIGGYPGGGQWGHVGESSGPGPAGRAGYRALQSQPHSLTNTTVIINQPAPMPVNTGPKTWSSGICSCCDDMGSCLLGTFCPLILACQVAGDMDESLCVPCCVPGWLIVLRTKLRAENNITGTVMDDCCMVCCCGICVLCQMKRELKHIRMSYRPSY